MQLKGNNVVKASPPVIWAMLMDPEILARIVPGVTRLEKTGDHTFKSILDIKLGPVSSSFQGDIRLEDIEIERGFTLHVKQNSRIGNAVAAIQIELIASGSEDTTVSFNGDVNLSGMLAGMGQRLLGGVSNTLTKQFFSNLDKEIDRIEKPAV